ncbi:MAG: creatininase family protein [Verrucomicrobiota bacterium]
MPGGDSQEGLNARPWLIAECSWKLVRETMYEVAVLPWGATEAHNFHLPYATDNVQLDHLGAAVGRLAWGAGAKVAILPTVPFGVNTGQIDIPLTINMNPSTQAAVLGDVIDSLSRQGIGKLVVLNGHGGNDFRQMCRELQVSYPEVFLSVVDWFRLIPREGHFENDGDHADEGETSFMLHVAPDLVAPLAEAGEGKANPPRLDAMKEGWAWAQSEWLKATNDTGRGDPSKASAEKGAKFFDALAKKIAGYLIDLAAADPDDLYER